MTGRWWLVFGIDSLNDIMNSALDSNFNLESYWQRLQAARAVHRRESSSLYPGLEAFADASTGNSINWQTGRQDLNAGLNAFYEIDLWGRLRTSVQAEEYRAGAAFSDYRAAAISLSSEVVITWFSIAAAQKQHEIISQQLRTNETMESLIMERFINGIVRSVDILRQRQLTEASRQQLARISAQEQMLQNRLKILSGRSPRTTRVIASLPSLPPMPETDIALKLLNRRPDVQAAWLRLKAADKDLTSAIRNRYPRLSLSTETAFRGDNISNMFENWAYSLAANMLAPVFYAGELKAEADRNAAVKQQLLKDYRQALLTAYREVEDALLLEKQQLLIIESLDEQLALAEQSYGRLRSEYFNGLGNYLDVLTALEELQKLQQQQLTARQQLLEYRVGLYRALAGGFETGRETR